MNILWLSHVVPYPPKGGVFQRSYNLIREIGKHNNIHLVSLNQSKRLKTPEEIESAVSALKYSCDRVDVFPIISDKSRLNWTMMTMISYFDSFPYDVNWLYNKDMMTFVNNLAKNEKYDLVHVDTCGLYNYAKQFHKSLLFITHHNVESQMMSKRYEMESAWLKKVYFKRESYKLKIFERNICGECRMNLVVSGLDAMRLKENVGEDINVSVIPNGVDLEYFQPSEYDSCKKDGLIFAGGMSVYTNREAMLYFVREIWPILKHDNPSRRVTIIGKNPPLELLKAKNDSNFIVTGFVDDVRPYFDSAKIYICPIKNGGGTRLKVLDALAMAKPLVATGFAVEGLELIDGEHYLRAENPMEFFTQIKRLENDPILCKKIALAGRQLVEQKYSWKKIGEILNETYKGLQSNASRLYLG